MKNYLWLTISFLFLSCGSATKTDGYKKNVKVYTGNLTDSTFKAVKDFLKGYDSAIKDTIIIRYYYNSEACWTLLDQKDDAYVLDVVKSNQERVANAITNRQQLSVFSFREPGDSYNKLVALNTTIITDTYKKLYKLLFKVPSICSNSIILMPDKKCIFLLSDPHADILRYSKEEIQAILNKAERVSP